MIIKNNLSNERYIIQGGHGDRIILYVKSLYGEYHTEMDNKAAQGLITALQTIL